MLVSLRIENFALVDRLELVFGPGLNVLTGETGAGKSIILDALDILLGGKIHSRIIRTGESKTLLEGSFALSDRLRSWLTAADIDLLDEPVLVCSREISNTQGTLRSRTRVNGVLVNKPQVEELRDRLVEITAQGQTLQLSQSPLQREWLDAFGPEILMALRKTIAEQFSHYQSAHHRLEQYRRNEQQCLQQIDMLRYQLQELQEANLSDPEEQTLLIQESHRLSHSVELQSQSDQAYQLLYDHAQGVACTDLLGKAATVLETMSAVDGQVQPILDLVQDALAQVQEAGSQIHRYGASLETDPQRLQEVEARLLQIKQICRKYGPALKDAIAHQSRIEQELESLTGNGQSIADLEAEANTTLATLTQSCADLTALRQAAAVDLETRLVQELKPLAMDKVQFQVKFTPIEPAVHGADRIAFVFSPNPGEPLQPLAETASGGEMSRFLLALKACFSRIDPVGTLVFDEVDVGVSGKIAQAIAEKLYHLSRGRQILCVTHQPIVAAMADQHFHVEKTLIHAPTDSAIASNQTQKADARTVVRIQLLEAHQRSQELANLAGGDTTDQMLAFAASLLQQAAQVREPEPQNSSQSVANVSRSQVKTRKKAS